MYSFPICKASLSTYKSVIKNGYIIIIIIIIIKSWIHFVHDLYLGVYIIMNVQNEAYYLNVMPDHLLIVLRRKELQPTALIGGSGLRK